MATFPGSSGTKNEPPSCMQPLLHALADVEAQKGRQRQDEALREVLRHFQAWEYEEKADLQQDWQPALELLHTSLTRTLASHPSLVLVPSPSSPAANVLETVVVNTPVGLNAYREMEASSIIIQRLHAEVALLRTAERAMVAPSPLTRGEREEAEDTKEGEDGGEAMLVDPPVPSLAREEEGEGGEEGGGGSTSVVPMVPPTRHVLAPAPASVKTLLYCLLTLLSIVFQSAGSAHIQGATEGSTYLRSPTLTSTLLDILSSLSALNAAVFSRAAGLIADIIGSDPSIISYVHNSGLAQAILSVLSTPLPPSCEVICEAPAILCALSISSQGLSALLRHNPFPSLFACLVHPAYVLPHSRAVLPPATPEAIGQRLEDLLQHHGSGAHPLPPPSLPPSLPPRRGPSTTPGQRLRDTVLNAAVHSLNRLVLSDLFYAGVGERKGREEGGGEVEASLERRRYFQYVGNAAYALA
ncbi:hypothetical protein NSK_008108, partial [Nannochloropsis salina CCMP1776]